MEQAYPSPVSETPNNKKFLFIALFLIVIVMFLATITFIISNASKMGQSTTAQNPLPPGTQPGSTDTGGTGKVVSQAAPQVKFSNWIAPKTAPSLLSSSSVYTFKQNYSSAEVQSLATKLKATTAINTTDPSKFTYYNTSNLNVVAFKFDKKTGSFSYVNTNGTPLGVGTAQTQDKIYDFLRTLGWYDPTIQVTANYKRKETPGVTYYELHRDWTRAGLPILNFLGLFNLNENQTLKSLSLNTKENMPTDDSVYGTSDNKDGYKRADDFNTMTVAVSQADNLILSINSNLRQIVPTATKTVSIDTYQAALQKLKNNQYTQIFTTPSGVGQISWQKIYPGNKAISDQAIVEESSYAYLEQNPTEAQSQLKPYILFKGTSVLDSGYSVNFVAAVDITSNTVASAGQVLGAHTYLAEGGDQSGKIDVTPTVEVPTPTGTVRDCQPQVSDLSPTIDYTDANGNKLKLGLGDYAHLTDKGVETRNEKRWYYIPPADLQSKSQADQLAVLSTAFKEFEDNIATLETPAQGLSNGQATLYCPDKDNPGHTDKTCKRTWELLLGDFQTYQGYYNQACPLIFSGLSPVLFVYGPEGKTVNIRSWGTLTYADPGTVDASWNIKIGSNGALNVNNYSRQSIYYEYAPVAFNRPELGWNIDRNNVTGFINTVANKMQLKSNEKVRLQQEITNAAKEVKGQTLFVGLIDQQELNSKLPLSINPSPELVERYHFYIGEVQTTSVKAPELKAVARKPFMVLEFGAVPGK